MCNSFGNVNHTFFTPKILSKENYCLKPRLHYAINLKRFVAAFFTIYLTRLILQVLLFTLRRQMPVSPPPGNVFLCQRVLCSGITSVVLCLAYSMCI